MEHTTEIAERYRAVLERVRRAAEAAGRDPDGIVLVAVSKKMGPERIEAAYRAGARDFGENYVQEALSKVDRLPPDTRWHMIGHLQSNKARRAVETFAWIHSLDRPSLGDALEKAAAARNRAVDVLIQVNVGGEATKSGTDAEGAQALLGRAGDWPHLRIRGLMTIPPYRTDPEEVRPYFRTLRELRDRLQAGAPPGVRLEHLSMGMSHDFPVAIEEGATMVRVGTAIFGERG
ncbi:MAG: YggS family pyridoxal phosphate-dependent enzyme [Deltaproteobacteria bacterium]|nr:YggS family pyridoxal phosphate-dependent enzyme [Deltaproteobacteria bacterium]